MLPKSLYLLAALALVFALVGCGGAVATPTKAPASPSPTQVVVIVTATRPPATPTAPATATSVPTTVLTPTAAVTATSAKPTSTRRPAPTRTATPLPVTPTTAANKYSAPRPISPIYDLGIPRKDERHFPADTLVFQWAGVGGLQGNECYQVNVVFTPGQSDTFLADCADQTPIPSPVSFTLNKPNGPGPNYSSLLPFPIANVTVTWWVTVVRDDGKAGSGAFGADGSRHKTTPLSPSSNHVEFPLKGG